MNRIVMGCLIGLGLVVGILMITQEEAISAAPAETIGSDAFFGQDPEKVRKQILNIPKPPAEKKGKTVGIPGPASGSRGTMSEPLNSSTVPAEDTSTSSSPPAPATPEPQNPPDDYIRGY